jgi:hypothetical protein
VRLETRTLVAALLLPGPARAELAPAIRGEAGLETTAAQLDEVEGVLAVLGVPGELARLARRELEDLAEVVASPGAPILRP